MAIRMKRNYDASLKVRIVLEAIEEVKTLAELASEFGVHPNQIRNWKNEFLKKTARAGTIYFLITMDSFNLWSSSYVASTVTLFPSKIISAGIPMNSQRNMVKTSATM